MPSISQSRKQKTVTLKQLEKMSFVKSDGQPATLYQIISRTFDKRADIALEAARAGDFSLIDALEAEVALLITQMVQHGLYLQGESAILKDPTGPKAQERAALFALASKNWDAMGKAERREIRLQHQVEILRLRLENDPPSVSMIETAKQLMARYARKDLPDWVEILANGNPEALAAVVEAALNDLRS